MKSAEAPVGIEPTNRSQPVQANSSTYQRESQSQSGKATAEPVGNVDDPDPKPQSKRNHDSASPARTVGGEYRSGLVLAYTVATVLRGMPLQKMLAEIDRADAVAPLFDPTLYVAKGEAMSEDRQVLAILARAKDALDRLPWPKSEDEDEPTEPAYCVASPSRLPGDAHG